MESKAGESWVNERDIYKKKITAAAPGEPLEQLERT